MFEVRSARFRRDLYLMKCKGYEGGSSPTRCPLPVPGAGGGEQSREGRVRWALSHADGPP